MTAAPRPGPRHLHPLTFVVGAVRELMALIGAAAAGLVVGGLTTGVYFTLIGLALSLTHHLVKWFTFTYAVYDDRVELRRALLGRSVKNIPIERIRGVDISATLGHRLLKLAVVRIDAAAGGDGGEEGTLNAVSRQEAERLRRTLLSSARTGPAHPDAVAPDVVYAQARPRWYLYAPLTGAYLLTPFAVAGSVFGTLYNLGDDLGLVTRDRLRHVGDDVLGLPVGLGVAAAVLVLLVTPAISIIAFALFNWNFTLRARDGAVVVERGLVTRRSVSLERRRIRGAELRDNLLERFAGVVRLRALVTGLGDEAHRGQLLPASPRGDARDVAARLLGGIPSPLTAHPPAARTRRVVRAMAPPLAVAVIALLAGQPWIAYACMAVSVLAVPLGLDRYRQLGHASDGARLSVRSGALRRRQSVVEHRAVVGWRLRQTLFQRRLGLATLVVALGAGDGGAPAVDMAETDAIAFAHRITPEWVAPFLERP
ncbi:PH domain-containing protein [Actinomadura alba]|uniref:PH domain-containing protein n=1 Tax=Actinomadura alba TaxID=406431 RepID=A0ABR7LJM6_9ACTN|nr:PH domain-containing protein [Actinomadura alba]MBC6465021.1 PH domain-containing protein [Actinomadura alba]